MADLFDAAADKAMRAAAPLADRVRPAALDGFIGQAHLIGPGTALRRAIEEDRVPSAIFYGTPGTGKTTLARIIAHATGSGVRGAVGGAGGQGGRDGRDRAGP